MRSARTRLSGCFFKLWAQDVNEPRPSPKRHGYRPALELLENRLPPATLTSPTAGVLRIDLTNANEALQIVSSGATYALTSTNTFVNGGFGANFTGYGAASGTLNPTGLTEIEIVD